MTADLLAFLRAAHDEIERVAVAAGPVLDGEWRVSTPGHGSAVEAGAYTVVRDAGAPSEDEAAHIALHDPRAALARVQAERMLLAGHEAKAWPDGGYYCDCSDSMPDYPCEDLRVLAWGHRHTVPGFDPAWAPEGVSADA